MTVPSRYRPGETALLAAVPEVEPLVAEWRRRLDPSASAGIPAHVTVLYPFLDIERIDDHALGTIRTLIGAHPAFDVRFEGFGRFPDVLYLAPAPNQPFRNLTSALVARWPDAPPYGGQFAEVIPHLTIAQGQAADVLDQVAAAVATRLPVATRVLSVQLLVSDGSHWEQRADFPLLG